MLADYIGLILSDFGLFMFAFPRSRSEGVRPARKTTVRSIFRGK